MEETYSTGRIVPNHLALPLEERIAPYAGRHKSAVSSAPNSLTGRVLSIHSAIPEDGPTPALFMPAGDETAKTPRESVAR